MGTVTLLTIPAELRVLIYEQLVGVRPTIYIDSQHWWTLYRLAPDPVTASADFETSALRICKLVSSEIRLVLESKLHLHIRQGSTLGWSPEAPFRYLFSSIRHLTIANFALEHIIWPESVPHLRTYDMVFNTEQLRRIRNCSKTLPASWTTNDAETDNFLLGESYYTDLEWVEEYFFDLCVIDWKEECVESLPELVVTMTIVDVHVNTDRVDGDGKPDEDNLERTVSSHAGHINFALMAFR